MSSHTQKVKLFLHCRSVHYPLYCTHLPFRHTPCHLMLRYLRIHSSGCVLPLGTVLNTCDCSICVNCRCEWNFGVLATQSSRRSPLLVNSSAYTWDIFFDRPFAATLQYSSQVSFPAPPCLQAPTDQLHGHLRNVWCHSHPVRWSQFQPDLRNEPWQHSQNPRRTCESTDTNGNSLYLPCGTKYGRDWYDMPQMASDMHRV